MKKLFAVLLSLCMLFSVVGCGKEDKTQQDTSADASGDKQHIIVLTPTESTGWTGSVATFAKEKVAEINEEGTYTAELLTAAGGSEQNKYLEDIAANYKKDEVKVVLLPFDDTVQSGIQSIIDAGIEYAAFDRIIDSVSSSAVANVKGDNEGVGAACAYYLVENGLQPGDKVFAFEGDTSSVTTSRKAGFEAYLLGNKEYNGKTIETAWTDADLASVEYSGALNWSQSEAKSWFETKMSDASNENVKYLVGFDDAFIIGVMDALNGSAISDDIKENFYAGKPYMTGCGGAESVYSILRGESDYSKIADEFGGVMSTTYSSSMIQTAIDLMVDHMNGEEVEQDYVIATEIVDSSNVTEYVGFN